MFWRKHEASLDVICFPIIGVIRIRRDSSYRHRLCGKLFFNLHSTENQRFHARNCLKNILCLPSFPPKLPADIVTTSFMSRMTSMPTLMAFLTASKDIPCITISGMKLMSSGTFDSSPSLSLSDGQYGWLVVPPIHGNFVSTLDSECPLLRSRTHQFPSRLHLHRTIPRELCSEISQKDLSAHVSPPIFSLHLLRLLSGRVPSMNPRTLAPMESYKNLPLCQISS